MSIKVYNILVEVEEEKVSLLKVDDGMDAIFYYEEIDLNVEEVISKFEDDLRIAKDIDAD